MIRIHSAASTNLTNVKASRGVVKGLIISNNNAAKRYLKLYNKASAPVLASDTPVLTIILMPNVSDTFTFPEEQDFPLGISYAITGAIADTDTTEILAGEVSGALFYA